MATRENTQQSFELRRRLTDLNYTEKFTPESSELINHLLNDLIATTNSYKIVQEKEARITSDLFLSQAQLFPLRKENARLARENHDLHNDTIRLNDEIRNGTEDYTRELQKMQEHLQDSRFLCESLQEQLKQNHETMDRLRSAYDAVTDPTLKSQGPGSLANANRAIKITSKVGKPGVTDAEAALRPPSANTTSSLVTEKENIIKTLRAQLDAANKAFNTKDDECKRLQSAVAAREQEITRSSKLLSAGTKGVLSSENDGAGAGMLLAGSRVEHYAASDVANKRLIDQLNGQVDFLNDELAKREAQLVEVNDKLLQYEALRAEFNHRNQLLEQARRELGQSSMRIRALEQKVIEYQNAETEFAVAAAEMGQTQAAGAASAESKQDNNGSAATRELIELKVLLGKVSSERDELREETARLRRIASTLTAPTASPNSSSSNTTATASAAGPAGVRVVAKRGTGMASKAATSPAAAASASGSRVAGQKEKQQAATNVLVIELNAEIETLSKKVQVLTRSLTQKEEQITATLVERDSYKTRAEVAEERKDKSALQQMHSSLQEQYSVCQLQLAESNRDRQQLRATVDSASSELSTTRKELHEVATVKEELEMRLTVVSKDLALSKQTVTRQSDDLLQASSEASRLRIECENLTEAVDREKRRAESAQSLAAEVQGLLDARSVELTEALHQLAMLRMAASGGAGQVAETQLMEDRKKLQLRVQELEADQLSSQRERRALQRVAQCLGIQFQYERAVRGQLEEQEVVLMLDTIAKKDAELNKAWDELNRAIEYSTRLESDVSLHAQAQRALQQELDALHAQHGDETALVAQYESDLALWQQRYASLKEQLDELQQRQTSVQTQHLGTSQQLNTTRRDLQTQAEAAMRLQQQVANLEEERDMLRARLEELNRRGKADKADLQRAIAERQEALERGEELKVLVSTLEASVRANNQKQHRLAAEVERGGEEQQHWDAEKSRLLAAIDEKDRRVRDQQESLKKIDYERDQLQEHVDAMEEEVARFHTIHRDHEQRHSSLHAVLEQTERKVQTLSVELTSAQRHAQGADARLNAAQLEIQELKRRISHKNAEVGGAAEDMMLMTRENQALTSELVEMSAERDRLQQRLQQVLHVSAEREHARRCVETERTELVNTYRVVLQEKRKLEEDLTHLSSRKQADGMVAHQLQDKVAELQGILAAQSAAENRWRGERNALVSQLDALNDQLIRTQHKVEALEADNRKMVHDTSGLKQNNVMLNERVNMILKRAGAATEANKLLTSRLSSVERERDAVRTLVGIERQRATDLSHIAESARVEAATKELHIQRLQAVTTTTTTVTSNTSRATTSHHNHTSSTVRVATTNTNEEQAASNTSVDGEFLTGSN